MRPVEHVATTIRILGLIVALNSLPAFAFFDQDGDGVSDANDNCTLTSNPQQIDSNADGIGNACDADLNNDGVIDASDQQLLIQFHQDNNLDGDMNDDGRIDNWDWNILKSRIGLAPGPADVGAFFYDRPRVLASGAKFSQLQARLTWQHFDRFWANTREAAKRYASRMPPCPQANPGCGAAKNITEYSESSIRGFGDILPPLAMAYRLSGEQVYLDGARKWMNALVSYEDWASNSDIGAGHILIGMSVTYDWLYDSFTESERQAYRDKMAYHANIFYDLLIAENSIWWKYNYYSNHNYTNALGLALTAIALYGEVDEADDWIAAARDNFDTVLSLLSPDGASLEGPSYWARQMAHLLPYFSAISRFAPQVGAQVLDNGFFQNAASYRLYSSSPDYLHVADYADNPRHDFYLSAHVLRGLAAIFNDSHAQWLAERLETARLDRGDPVPSHWLDLLWYHPEIPPTPPNDLPPYKHFDNMGVLFARSSWDEDAFWSMHKSGPFQGYHAEALGFYRGSHAHPDTGQFLAWSQGRWLIIEDGYVNLKRTENHNLLTFNGNGQLGSDFQWFNSGEVQNNAGTVVPLHSSFTDDAAYMVTEIAPMYRAAADVASWQRSFIALPEGYQVIRDDVILNNPGQIENLVHADLIAYEDGASAILNPRQRMTEAFDRSGKGNDGFVTGGYASDGKSGSALHFLGDFALQLTGAMDKVVIPTLSGSAFPASGSLSLWLKSDSFAGQGIVNIFDAVDPSRDHIYIRTSRGNPSVPISGIEVGFQSDNGDGWALGVGLHHDVWHHLVITWDSANDQGQVYINNTLIYSAAINDADWTPSAQLAKIGGGFIGSIDDMNLYSAVLDPFQITSLFNLASVTTDLEGSWTFDGIDNNVMPEFREYSYRLVYPTGSTLNSAQYLLPPEERAGPQGNYWGQLFSNSYSSSGNETIIHFVGDVSTPVNYDAATNNLSISHDTYSIEIDFDAKSVIRSPNQ